ncbi:MAG: hypothetical protein B7Y36_18975 [Novosphingobium sp. 28-62-57]|uniref:phage minor head protein n=1 Tax=Novosphingobium sp. 28-62-57 TaxID=1970409 RepID=UPI000BCD3712|nr:phage minor head protein [Novosphingobium sp. 28-62-57]OYZ07696.1 MAG: hypothetical protein B7Y36_18975 [Novosphingobium sp. 28-62-57]OZA36639.1 MAG: hypothetical protein B7X92_05880 [Novosphingobium sp. 17-62-9]HQS96697.1 phage minor head protein [Novosphingobium sp.]
MRYNLRAMFAQRKPRKRTVTFDKVSLPQTLASDLYAQVYALVIREWSAGIPAIMAEYERSLSELTTDTAAEVSGVVSSVEAGAALLAVTVKIRLERWAAQIEAAHRRRWVAAIKRATSIDVAPILSPADMRVPLQTVVERNVVLVSSVNTQAKDRIADAVLRGLSEKKAPREVAKEIRGAVEMGRARALRIASDQTSKVSETLNEERRTEAGLSTWEWVHSGKKHPREDHKARNGKRYDDDAKSGSYKPPAVRPGQLPFCGCTSRAVLSVDSEF